MQVVTYERSLGKHPLHSLRGGKLNWLKSVISV